MLIEPPRQFGIVFQRPALLGPGDPARRQQGIGLGRGGAWRQPGLGRAAQDPAEVGRRRFAGHDRRVGPDAGGLQLVGLALQHVHPAAVTGGGAVRGAADVAGPLRLARPEGIEHPPGVGRVLQVIDPIEMRPADPARQGHGRPEALPVARGFDMVEIAARPGQFGEARGGQQGDVDPWVRLADPLQRRQRQHELAERTELDHQDAGQRLHAAPFVMSLRIPRHG